MTKLAPTAELDRDSSVALHFSTLREKWLVGYLFHQPFFLRGGEGGRIDFVCMAVIEVVRQRGQRSIAQRGVLNLLPSFSPLPSAIRERVTTGNHCIALIWLVSS
jgi:hypothetical protein